MSKIKQLEEQINKSSEAYYNGTAIISDDEFDALVYELSCLDPKSPILSKVGAEPIAEWKKEKHLYPLGSLDKVNTPVEMEKWIVEKIQNRAVVVSEKLDGLSLGCQYENGKLVKALLRGGGEGGENILPNVLKMKGVTTNIPGFTGVLRGEIVLTKSDHQQYFASYSNPRNAASGICRRLDGQGCEHLTLMFYQVLGADFKTETEQFQFLKQNKCLTPNYKLCKTFKEVNQLWQEYQDTIRISLDYEIDGLVVCVEDIEFQQSLGETNLRPKGKLAFKFANQFVKTTIAKVDWQAGASGRITPVCYVEPVQLLGSRVEKASAYNVAYVEKLGLGVGAEVLICKAGEIIPRIEKVIKPAAKVAEIPAYCPIPDCIGKLEMVGENLTCTNTMDCPAQIEGRLTNWIKELNILEWGTALISQLVDVGLVETVADLYTLTVEDLAELERMGEKSAKKAYNLLWAGSEITIETLLGSLSIPMVGVSTFKLLVENGYDTLEKIKQLTISQLENISGIGPVKAKSIVEGLAKNEELIEQLLENGVKIKEKIMGNLTGKSFCFTGTMTHKRAELEQMVTESGGEVKGSVGKGLNFLVIADPTSITTKATKARSLGTALISEEEFLAMVQ